MWSAPARSASANRMICWNTGAATSAPKMLPGASPSPRWPRAGGCRPARTRRTTRCTRRCRTAPCGRCRSCPPPDSRGSGPSCPSRSATTFFEHAGHRVGGRRPTRPGGARAAARRDACPSASIVAVDQAGRPGHAVVGDRRVHVEHLHRRDRDAVADRDRPHARVGVLLERRTTMPGDSPGRPSPVGCPKPNASRYCDEPSCPSSCAILIVPTFDDWARMSATVIVDECSSTSS